MKQRNERAYAKINVTLEVVGKREDGYHELRSIFLPVQLSDDIQVRVREGNQHVRLISPYPKLNTPHNLMYKAAKMFLEHFHFMYDVEIEYTKKIPSQAGLGGGSADAAAVFRALVHLLEVNVSNDEMIALCTAIGADVPFCYFNRPALVSGIGEKLMFFENNLETHIVLIKPKRGASTKRIFENLQQRPSIQDNYSKMMQQALLTNDANTAQQAMFNSLEQPACQLIPEIATLKSELCEKGCLSAVMSGSGSTVVCFIQNEQQAKQLVNTYKKRGYFATLTNFLKEDL